jgi:hypothetical protein
VNAAGAPSLRELQRWFASVTTHPAGVLDGRLGHERSQKLERLVTPGPRLSAVERVQIYQQGYFARLVECLLDDYPALSYALGDATFEALARAYIEKHPSRSRSLNAYGQHLATFCRSRPEAWASCAADLARLEWALVEVIHEPVDQRLAPDALAKIPAARWQTARLLPSRGMRLLDFDYPVNDFFQAFRDERAPELPERAPTTTRRAAKPPATTPSSRSCCRNGSAPGCKTASSELSSSFRATSWAAALQPELQKLLWRREATLEGRDFTGSLRVRKSCETSEPAG